ncbi:SRPBCC family protein [Streptomyces sp. NPDC005438]|uniref:SRPBCC family protein n=1 Tax=Streptomyces sp. NPDC005438 TaxID=3156880 RepID=UPI0033BAF42E
MRQLRSVRLDFTDTAPTRLVSVSRLNAPAEAVFRALAREVEAYPEWFPGVRAARAEGDHREVSLRGGTRFVETVLCAEEAERYTYRTDSTNAPGVSALLEDWRLLPDGHGGTRVRWVVAADGPLPVRGTLRLSRVGAAWVLRRGLRRLERRLGEE